MAKIDLSIILPAYKEAENLKILLPKINSVIKGLGLNGEVLIVDSKKPLDHTPQVCRDNKVRHVPRLGDDTYGSAVRTGIARSKGKYVVLMDADGSHTPEFIEKLWALRDSSEIIIASRYIAGGHTHNSWPLVAMSYLLNIVYSNLLRLPVTDISNSFRLYRGGKLRKLSLDCAHFDIQEEILVKLLWKYTQSVSEIPYDFKKRISGKSKRVFVVFVYNYLKSLVKLYKLKKSYGVKGAVNRHFANKQRSKP